MGVKNKPPGSRSRLISNILFIVSGLFLLTNLFFPQLFGEPTPQVPYSMFIDQVEDGNVARASVGQNEIVYELKDQNAEQPQVYKTNPVFDLELPKRLENNGVEFAAAPPPKNGWLGNILGWVIPPLIFVAIWQFFISRSAGGAQGALSLTKSRAKVYVEGDSTKVTFDDVAGVEEAKTELTEIVDFLKTPQRYKAIGARIPKGVLLVGPPGTGKTLMAKAVAGEAGVPFFSISGSEFVELFVGAGAARVRDLFEQAKQKAPCIVFIDELDAIGQSRSGGSGFVGGNDEREQTLNQLLTEMDGFAAGDATVIVLAATNRPEVLDPALLRPGRFDRQVLVDRPDLAGRQKILEIYAAKVKLDVEVDLKQVATRTPGFAGADLANLVNEAALLAARNNRETVTQADFNEAIERVVAGLEKKSRVLNDKEKKIVAYHEVGHALVGAVMPGGGRVAKISIVPRGMAALGYTLQMPTEDRFLMSESELRDQIATMLGGRAAEEVVFNSITTGASNDLQRATDLAERMVTTYGMSEVLGPLAYEKGQQNNFLGQGMGNPRRMVSDETAKAIDEEVKGIVENAHQQALDILNHNRDLLEQIAREILEVEVIEGKNLQSLLDRAEKPQQHTEESETVLA